MSVDSNKLIKLHEHLNAANITTKLNSGNTNASWYRYYAGYTPDFVKETLEGLSFREDWVVLDPWNGAGTTTNIASQLGCGSVGIDINPIATILSSARSCNPEDTQNCAGLIDEMINFSNQLYTNHEETDALDQWFETPFIKRYRRLEAAILYFLANKGDILDPKKDSLPPLASFFLLALIESAKDLAILKKSSNPTWIGASGKSQAPAEALIRAFRLKVEKNSIKIRLNSAKTKHPKIIINSSKELPLADSSIDAVITSPPYCTRIDYFKSTLFELNAIGIASNSDHLRALRLGAMGTSLIRNEKNETEHLPDSIRDLLTKISTHSSYSSATYYRKYYTQYFSDAFTSINEIKRVLKDGGACVVVVQDSYYKDIHVPLGKLFTDLARQAGLASDISLKIPVKKALSSLNTKSSKYVKEKLYTEEVVAMFK